LIDNCAFKVESKKNTLLDEKMVDLDKLYGILNDGKLQMKVDIVINRDMQKLNNISVD
jgi:hypothetical protein